MVADQQKANAWRWWVANGDIPDKLITYIEDEMSEVEGRTFEDVSDYMDNYPTDEADYWDQLTIILSDEYKEGRNDT